MAVSTAAIKKRAVSYVISRQSAPRGKELVKGTRFKDSSGEDVGADFGALFQDHHINARIELLQADGRSETGGPRAHDKHIRPNRVLGCC